MYIISSSSCFYGCTQYTQWNNSWVQEYGSRFYRRTPSTCIWVVLCCIWVVFCCLDNTTQPTFSFLTCAHTGFEVSLQPDVRRRRDFKTLMGSSAKRICRSCCVDNTTFPYLLFILDEDRYWSTAQADSYLPLVGTILSNQWEIRVSLSCAPVPIFFTCKMTSMSALPCFILYEGLFLYER